MSPFRLLAGVLAVGLVLQLGSAVRSSAEVIVVASDSTIQVRDGEIVIDPEGKWAVSIIGLEGQEPTLKASIPLGNSLFGPPVNIGVTPDERLALISEALRLGEGEQRSTLVPSNIVHVVDLTVDPPAEIRRCL